MSEAVCCSEMLRDPAALLAKASTILQEMEKGEEDNNHPRGEVDNM